MQLIQQLILQIKLKKSFLCVGLDPDVNLMPSGYPKNPEGILAFNQDIIHATKHFAVAYKLNTAFYEVWGAKGWEILEKTLALIPDSTFKIADAKRGDIQHSAAKYAETFFKSLNFDALTVSPFLGLDSLEPFLKYDQKMTIVLGLTSNPGAADFQKLLIQQQVLEKPLFLFEKMIKTLAKKYSYETLMFVIGATNGNLIREIRDWVPKHFFLVPGVGTQQGSLEHVIIQAKTNQGGLIINVGRDLIYQASSREHIFDLTNKKAAEYHLEMLKYL